MRTRRDYTQQFKDEAVRLVLQEGLSTPEAARRMEISDKTLANWVRLARAGKPLSAIGTPGEKRGNVSEMEMEISKLRAEVARLKMEKEILKNVWSAPAKQGHSFRSVQPVLRQCIRPVDEARWLLALMEPARIDPHKAFGHVGPHF